MSNSPQGSADPEIAVVAKALSDPGRVKILMALCDGRALPASRLAEEAGVSPSTMSAHLRFLRERNLVEAEPSGRWKFYRIKNSEVAGALESLAVLAPQTPVSSLRAHRKTKDLRRGRTCYKHLAGRLGVDLLAAMIDAGWIRGGDGQFHPELGDVLSGAGRALRYEVTEDGSRALAAWGIPSRVRKPGTPLKYCVDWTEQAHHLAGPLGTAICAAFQEQGWIRPGRTPRSQKLTDDGRTALNAVFAWSDDYESQDGGSEKGVRP